MLNCKVYSTIIFCSLLAVTGCIESKYPLDIKPTLNERANSFLNRLPGINKNGYSKMPVITKAKTVEVYIASFKESSIEKDNLLEITELNSNSTHPVTLYREVDGFSQDIYMLKYQFTCSEHGTPTPVTAIVFLPLRYRQQKSGPPYCTGPGPVYWGVLNETDEYKYISFDSVVHIKAKGNKQYLKMDRHKKNELFNLLFMPANFAEVPEKSSAVNFTKIVRMGNNRIGGTKPIVFNVPQIFKDSNALQFNYYKTIILNP